MKRFKTAVNTVIANFQETKSQIAFEELKKIETTYTERVLERIGLFDKKKNDIKVLIQRNIIKDKDLKDIEFYFSNSELFENNRDIKKLKETLKLFEKVLSINQEKIYLKTPDDKIPLQTSIISTHIKPLTDYIKKYSSSIITIENINNFNKILTSFISKFVYKLLILKNNITNFENGMRDYMSIVKYIIIILGINIKIINYTIILDIINKKTTNKKLLNNSISSQSLNSNYNKKDIVDIINKNNKDPSSIHLKDAKKYFKNNNNKYKHLIKELELFNKLIKRVTTTLELLYNLFLRNAPLFIYKLTSRNKIPLTKEILDKIILSVIIILKELETKKLSFSILENVFKNISVLTNSIDPYRGGRDDIELKDNIKIGDFQKGYKDFKNYLRYISILKTFNKKVLSLLQYSNNDSSEDSELKSIMTAKSSNRSYKSAFKKDKSIESYDIHGLSSEPLSAIKSSPKYSTYFAEK
jgi:hypothetical protein